MEVVEVVEVFREIEDRAEKIVIDLVDCDRIRYTFSRLARVIAKEYNVDSEVLLNTACICEFIDRYIKRDCLCDDLDTLIIIEIIKYNKTADELKREIKRVTKDLEKLVQTLIDAAKELREQQNLEGWIWERARYDTEKRRFVKCD